MRHSQAIYIGSDIYEKAAFGQNHPLAYMRQGFVVQLCRQLGWFTDDNYKSSPVADFETLIRYHDPDYVRALRRADLAGKASVEDRKQYNFGTMENPLFQGVFERASTTVGGSILAAEFALQGHTVFHPSGGTHHGMRDKAHGFCYFNDPVFAILTFLDAGLERVLYVDIDAHHGDGVELAFQDDPRVHCLSIHEANRWPYSGQDLDLMPGRLNVPVPQGLNDSEFDYIFNQIVEPFCQKLKPQAIVITCGADALAGDPLSKMNLTNNGLWDAVLRLRDLSERCVVLGGGGYNPWTTVRCWAGLWGRLAGYATPDNLPAESIAMLSGFDSDLIDVEDRHPEWTSGLADAPVPNSFIRGEIESLVAILSKQHGL